MRISFILVPDRSENLKVRESPETKLPMAGTCVDNTVLTTEIMKLWISKKIRDILLSLLCPRHKFQICF